MAGLAQLFSFGPRRAMGRAVAALASGNFDEAASGFRDYFAARLPRHRPLRGIDAEAATLAATCAALRGDGDELRGIAGLLEAGMDDEATAAVAWTKALTALLDGDTAPILAACQDPPRRAAPFVAQLLVVAAERGVTRFSPEAGAALA